MSPSSDDAKYAVTPPPRNLRTERIQNRSIRKRSPLCLYRHVTSHRFLILVKYTRETHGWKEYIGLTLPACASKYLQKPLVLKRDERAQPTVTECDWCWCHWCHWSRESVVSGTGAIREIFVVGLVRCTISRVLPLWLAQLDCNGLVEAALHRESPLVRLLSLSVQSIALLEMPVVR